MLKTGDIITGKKFCPYNHTNKDSVMKVLRKMEKGLIEVEVIKYPKNHTQIKMIYSVYEKFFVKLNDKYDSLVKRMINE